MTSRKVPVSVLKDVVAFVDVWSASKTENYSDPFIHQLQDLGARVSKTLNKHVTHVVFKHGHQATWNKAQKMGVKVVSAQWVARCMESTAHVDEELYPAQNDESKLIQLKKRTHRCMQPRDSPSSTPTRLKRKLDKMMEDLARSSPVVTGQDTSPFIINEEHGIVYSPSSRRADTMAQRLKEMRALRENLSPTASQIQDSSVNDDSLRPSLGATPTSFSRLLEEEEETPETSPSSYLTKSEKGTKQSNKKPAKKQTNEHVENFPLDLDGVRAGTSNENKQIKVKGSTQNKKQRKSSSERTSQSSLDSFIGKTFSRKSEARSSSKSEASTTVKSRDSLRLSRRSKISTSVGSTEAQTSPVQERSEAKVNTNPLESGRTSSVERNPSTCDRSAKSKDPNTPGSSHLKIQRRIQASVLDSYGHPDSSSEPDDGVFEDYFTSSNCPSKPKVVLARSSSGARRLPSFDLKPVNSHRRQSQSHKSFEKKQTHHVLNHQDPPSPTTSDNVQQFPRVASTVPQELKFEEPAAKRPRRRTKQISLTPPESADSQGASNGLVDGRSELCSSDPARHSVRMDKYMKKNRTLVMTSMPTEKQQTVRQVVNCLGGFSVVDSVCDSTTHVVSGSPRRTLNILLGIARGCWILSFEWILWCLEHRKWVPEEPYELSDHFPAAPICRLQQHLSAGEHQQDLFREQPPMYVSSLSQPPCNSLLDLIQLCGGAVCRSVRQAGVCVGEYKGKRPEGVNCLSEQWILDCVTHHVVLPYDNYIID